MQLNVLTDGDVGDAARVDFGEAGDGAKLAGVEQSVGNANAQHEEGKRLAFAATASDHPGAVPLGVDTPPAEVSAEPFGRDGGEAFPRESADFVEREPRVLFPLQTLHSLRFALCGRHGPGNKKKPAADLAVGSMNADFGLENL